MLSGSPLFSGAAGSGESEIRRWIIESDLLEGIVALPDQMFYNTGISTYVWVLTNTKPATRAGKVALIDGRDMFAKMRKSLGDKRKYLPEPAIDELVRLYDDLPDDVRVKVLPNETFGFQRLTVERPLRRRWEVTDGVLAMLDGDSRASAEALAGRVFTSERQFTTAVLPFLGSLTAAQRRALVKASAVPDPDADPATVKGAVQPDPDLRDNENIPLPDGYLDMTKIGYEIPFTRQFYVYTPPRPVAEIAAEIRDLEDQIQGWMKGLGV